MPERRSGVHVVTTVRKYKDREYKAHLLRRSYREDGKVKKETLGNITTLGDELVAEVRAGSQGQPVGAVARAIERLGLAKLLASRASQERSIILALITQRVLSPASKLGCNRKWHETSLADEFGVGDVRVDQVFDAMDWLAARQGQSEERLAARHLSSTTPLLFDLSSSCVEGKHDELAAYGQTRAKKRGKNQVNYGILTDPLGCPVALRVFTVNTSDPSALRLMLAGLRAQFGLRKAMVVGDRGMITSKHVRRRHHRIEQCAHRTEHASRILPLLNGVGVHITRFQKVLNHPHPQARHLEAIKAVDATIR